MRDLYEGEIALAVPRVHSRFVSSPPSPFPFAHSFAIQFAPPDTSHRARYANALVPIVTSRPLSESSTSTRTFLLPSEESTPCSDGRTSERGASRGRREHCERHSRKGARDRRCRFSWNVGSDAFRSSRSISSSDFNYVGRQLIAYRCEVSF